MSSWNSALHANGISISIFPHWEPSLKKFLHMKFRNNFKGFRLPLHTLDIPRNLYRIQTLSTLAQLTATEHLIHLIHRNYVFKHPVLLMHGKERRNPLSRGLGNSARFFRFPYSSPTSFQHHPLIHVSLRRVRLHYIQITPSAEVGLITQTCSKSIANSRVAEPRARHS